MNRPVAPILGAMLVPALLVGCSVLDGWRDRPDPTAGGPPVVPDAEIVAANLQFAAELTTAEPTRQAELVHQVRSDYLAEPSVAAALRYALVLATPGHGSTDLAGARSLLTDTLIQPALLQPAERALATLTLKQLSAQLALEQEILALRAAEQEADSERNAALSRRLQAQMAENHQLRQELSDAKAKLDAIAALEQSLQQRVPSQGQPR